MFDFFNFDKMFSFGSEILESSQEKFLSISYMKCRYYYEKFSLGKRLVESLPKFALSNKRVIIMQDAPQEVVDQYEKVFREYKALQTIRDFCFYTRIYGMAGLFVATDDNNNNENLTKGEVKKHEIRFNVLDPKSIAGLNISQDPLSFNYQRIVGATINGRRVGSSRFFTAMNGTPIFLQFESSNFNFGGRSVFNNMEETIEAWQEVWYSLKKIAWKAGSVLIEGSGGSVTSGASVEAKTKSVETLENMRSGVAFMPPNTSANMMQLSGIDGMVSILNELKAVLSMSLNDTPTAILLDRELSNGLSEGREDMNAVETAVNNYREEYLEPVFDFIDSYLFYKAWDDKFLDSLRVKYPSKYSTIGNEQLREFFIQQFQYEWQSIRPETRKEKMENNKSVLEQLELAKNLGANLADIEKELNESEVFKNSMHLEETQLFNDEFDNGLSEEYNNAFNEQEENQNNDF